MIKESVTYYWDLCSKRLRMSLMLALVVEI